MAPVAQKFPGRKARDLSGFACSTWLAPDGICSNCCASLGIHQHRVRALQLLGSRSIVTQKDRCCTNPECGESRTLIRPVVAELRLVLKGCEYGLDVIGMVGERHLHEHKSFGEVHEELTETYGVRISTRHVSNLFRVYLAIVEARTLNSAAVQARLRAQGRLILSMDAVKFDDISPALYVVREVLSGEVLLAERVEKADTENLVQLLRKLGEITATVPVAGIVTDKEKAMISAVATVFPGVPHQYCQTHFYGNLVKPMDSDLAALGSGVDTVAKGVREIAQRLEREKADPEEHQLVKMVCESVQIIGKTRGDKLFDPTSLKRFTKMNSLREMLEKALVEKAAKEPARTWPLLYWLLAKLAILVEWGGLAARLARQVETVREIAHILNVDSKGKTVELKLRKYLNKLRQRISKRDADKDWCAFSEHIIAVSERFWAGLFACYDVKGLPRNNNELESFFRAVKWHQRRVQGKKSTSGGPLESFAPLLIHLWPQLQKRPELEDLLKDLSPEEVKRGRDGLKSLAEPARKRRSFRRDSDAQIQSALATWVG